MDNIYIVNNNNIIIYFNIINSSNMGYNILVLLLATHLIYNYYIFVNMSIDISNHCFLLIIIHISIEIYYYNLYYMLAWRLILNSFLFFSIILFIIFITLFLVFVIYFICFNQTMAK